MAEQKDFSEFVDKKVILVQNLKEPNEKGEGAVEIEGTVVAANAIGILLKPKGQVKPVIIEVGDVEQIGYAPEKIKAIKAKMLKPITYGQAKSHLLERHGMTLTDVNKLSEEEALKYHNGLDHKVLDLGHVHGDKASTARAEAVAAAEGDAA